MDIRPLSEIAAADELTLRFTPLGFGLDRKLSPEGAARFHQEAIAGSDLVEAVPDEVRAAFQSLRVCHTYGVLSYRLFTHAANLSFVVLEQALRARFLEFYDGVLPVENDSGQSTEIDVRSFEEANDGFGRGGQHAKHGWKLRGESPGERHPVPLTLAPLLAWARREHLLDGQRAKQHERGQSRFRNWFVHGNDPMRGMPQESARRINELAETINRLWGARTPGGRLYPAPMSRGVVAIAWSTRPGQRCWAQLRPEQIPEHLAVEGADWTMVLLLAVPTDDELFEFDSRYERTRFPAELLWGPGEGSDAFTWWRDNHPQPDTIEHLDRLFAIHVDAGTVYLPQRPEATVGLPEARRRGRWHVIRADFPIDAFVHVRNLQEGTCSRASQPACGCAIEEVIAGPWTEIVTSLGIQVQPPPHQARVHVPLRFPLPSTVGCD